MTARLRLAGLAALLAAGVSGLVTSSAPARADGTAQTLPFSQNWTNTGLITVNDNWTAVPGVIGFLGDDPTTTAAPIDPRTILTPGVTQDVIANQTNPNTNTAGGVAEFDTLPDPVVALQGSGTADWPYLQLHLDTTGFQNIQVSYNLRDIDGSADNAVQPVALQYRIGSSGNFTNVAGGFVADASTGPNLATLVTPVSVTLPADANNQPLVQVRIITGNATGSDEWVGVDDINVTGSPLGPSGTGNANPNPVVAGNSTLLTVATTPQGGVPITSVVADLTAIGGSASQAFSDDGTGGDVTAGDGIYSYLALVPSDTTGGNKSLLATITDADARTGTCTISLDVLPSTTSPTGVGAASPSIVPVGADTTLTVTVTPGANPTSTGIQVVADLSSIGGSATQTFFDDGTNGDVTPGDNMFTLLYGIPMPTTPGAKTLPATITDAEGRTGSASISLTVTSGIPPVVVSQVYGAGGDSGAAFRNDFVELFNRGTEPVDLTGWSVQYASATGTTWAVTPLSGALGPGRYFLVQQAGGGSGANLPAPDATGTTALSATAGKVLLIRTTTAQAGTCPSDPLLMDLAGYGSSADCFEGSGPAPAAGSATQATLRLLSGCTDGNNNAADFMIDAAQPRNTSTQATNCAAPPSPAPLFTIDAIQGSGSASPLVGQVVRTRGIVTGRTSNTYFLQTPDDSADNDLDPDTSEGLIVFTSTPPTVAVGQFVETTGTVAEFIPGADPNSPPKTEITQAAVTVFSAGNLLPAPVTITSADTSPAGSIEQLEKYEAMRVQVNALTVSGPSAGNVNEPNATSTNTGVFYGVIQGLDRPFREPGIEVPDPLPPGAPNNIPRFDANPERIRVDSDLQPGAVALAVAAGDTVSNVVGPLDYSFRTYTIAPDPATPPQVTPGTPPAPPPAPAASQFTVASFNVERFFDTVNDPLTQDAVLTPTAFNNRLNKLSLFVRNILRTPDIIGFQEVENLTTLQAMGNKVNADAVAGGAPDPGYQAFLQEGNDIGGIDVGFLVKSSRVDVVDVTQFGKDTTYIDPNTNQPALLNDRPPLVLRASVHAPAAGPSLPVTVIVNHLRSLSGVDDPVDGNRVRTKRRAQAEYLANLIQGRQVADPNERLVVIGDMNAFGFNDGYGDSVGTIKGQPTPPDQVVLASPDLVDPDLTNLEDLAPADQRYSFVFDGNAQTLDHAMVSQNVLGLVADLHRGRGNADSPDTLRNDPARPERLADHDPLMVYFNFPTQTQTALVSSLNPSQFGQAVTFTAGVTAGGNPVTTGSVTFRDGTQVLGTVNVNGSGQAAVTTSSLSAGPHSISATFNGTATLDVSSASLTQTVNAAGTTTTAASSVNPSGFTQPVTFTATVSYAGGPVTQGTVTFLEGATVLAGPLALDANGRASFSISTLAVGSHVITASYSGTTNFAASTGNITQNVQPGVTVTDVFVTEGNAPGTVAAVFNVRLTAASALPVTVSFATQDGTALAGSDYTGRTGQVLFPGTVTSRAVAVVILSDTLNEADETFFLGLSAATGAVILDSQGAGTILNDDPLPALTVNDISVREPLGPAVFTVRLSVASGRDVTVDYTTADGSATAPADYAAREGTLAFPAGTTTLTVTVPISADTLPEDPEDFFLVLSNPTNVNVADGLGVCVIRSGGPRPGPALEEKAAIRRR